MLKDKVFIGRICRIMHSDQPIEGRVLKVIRTEDYRIIGFEFVLQYAHSEHIHIFCKDEVLFQINQDWLNGSDLIIHLLEQKMNALRREMKIRQPKKMKSIAS